MAPLQQFRAPTANTLGAQTGSFAPVFCLRRSRLASRPLTAQVSAISAPERGTASSAAVAADVASKLKYTLGKSDLTKVSARYFSRDTFKGTSCLGTASTQLPSCRLIACAQALGLVVGVRDTWLVTRVCARRDGYQAVAWSVREKLLDSFEKTHAHWK